MNLVACWYGELLLLANLTFTLHMCRPPAAVSLSSDRADKQMYEEVGGGKAVAMPSEGKPPQQPRYKELSEVTHDKEGKPFSTQRHHTVNYNSVCMYNNISIGMLVVQ